MTVTIELSPEREAALLAQAWARGLTIQQLVPDLVEQHMPLSSVAHLQRSNLGNGRASFARILHCAAFVIPPDHP